jgi:hypothetical protein
MTAADKNAIGAFGEGIDHEVGMHHSGAHDADDARPAMKKISTARAQRSEKVESQRLTVGLDWETDRAEAARQSMAAIQPHTPTP